jgi:hypothetical protein
MSDHEEDAGESGDVVGVHMGEADGSELAKAPTERFPGYLCTFATVKKSEVGAAAQEHTGEPAAR